MSSGFVTEGEIAEARRIRQEEWEKVRQADQPLEAPEETYDRRSLFERLQEQKQKKELEYEEAHKLKNMIKGLDDDEVEYLDLVDRTKLAAEHKKNLDEERELNDYRSRVATLQEKSLDARLQAEMTTAGRTRTSPKHSQQKLLRGAVIRKRKLSTDEHDAEKRRRSEGALTCIAVLPGLGCYNDSSDSELSSDSDQDCVKLDVDLLGRKIVTKKPDEAH